MSRRYWFSFTGLDGQEPDISKYTRLSGNPNVCAPQAKHLCAIYVPSSNSQGTTPTTTFYSGRIQTYIGDALASGLKQPIAGPPYYVYVKTV
jgi:hypothetical protein